MDGRLKCPAGVRRQGTRCSTRSRSQGTEPPPPPSAAIPPWGWRPTAPAERTVALGGGIGGSSQQIPSFIPSLQPRGRLTAIPPDQAADEKTLSYIPQCIFLGFRIWGVGRRKLNIFALGIFFWRGGGLQSGVYFGGGRVTGP